MTITPELAKPQEPAIDYDKLASILDGRQKATEDSVLKGYFKEQGLSDEEMAQAIKSFKDAKAKEAAQKEDAVTGLQKRVEQMEQEIANANEATARAQLENVIITEATKAGIDAKWIPVVSKVADLEDVAEGGVISAEKVAAAIAKLTDTYPEMKPKAQDAGFKVGLAEDKADASVIENDKLKAIFGVK